MWMSFAIFGEGGIVRLSRCIRENLIPHCIRDCLRHPAQAVLAGRTQGGSSTHPLNKIKKGTLADALFQFGGEGGIRTPVRILS
jgi:hypothetical protein